MQLRRAVKFEITLHDVADVFQRLGHGRALRMAARQFGATDGHAFGMFEQGDVIFAFHLNRRLRFGADFVNAGITH